MAINSRKVNYILDAYVENSFGAVDRTWMVRFLEHRIGCQRALNTGSPALSVLSDGGEQRR